MRALFFRALVAVSISVAGAGCGKDNTPTSPTATAPPAFSTFFGDTISASATKFYSFQSTSGGPVQITLASLTSASSGALVAATPTMGFGIPAGTGCSPSTTITTSPGLSAQIAVNLTPGIYCVSITGNGGISADTNFAIRITQGTLTAPSTASPMTFASNLAPKGASTQTFTVAGGTTGTVTATIDVNPARTVGFGIGMWRPDTSTCSLTQSVNTAGGAQLTATVDQGTYCVKVFDIATLPDFVAFTVKVTHP